MTPTRKLAVLGAALIVAAAAVAACAKPAEESAATATTGAAETGLAAETKKAAAIANAITAAPDKVDSILTANAMDQTQLEAMMMRIARDSAAAAEYARLTARP